ncbi:MAG: hypothetical protein U1E29_02730 [Coriobacteriia bacterium]|nr:hypothetical protein [Coriobacteriia bacterium]
MNGPLWAQVVVGIVALVPLLVIGGALVSLLAGGIMGCTECLLARLGAVKFTPGVVSIKHHGIPTAVG